MAECWRQKIKQDPTLNIKEAEEKKKEKKKKRKKKRSEGQEWFQDPSRRDSNSFLSSKSALRKELK
jgi:hypothetical protein